MTNFKRRKSRHKFCKRLLRPSWFLSWVLAYSSRNSQAISDSAWKGTCILFTAVLKPYSIKRLPKPLTSILLNIPPTLRNYYLIQGVISSWPYYTHPPWQSREKNTQLWSIRKSKFKTSTFIEINANLFRSQCNKTECSLLIQKCLSAGKFKACISAVDLHQDTGNVTAQNATKKSRWKLKQKWF